MFLGGNQNNMKKHSLPHFNMDTTINDRSGESHAHLKGNQQSGIISNLQSNILPVDLSN